LFQKLLERNVRNGILLPKLFSPTVRKKRPRICRKFEITKVTI